ncbi:hypothetical protein X471_00164 [Bartonella bacilliformis str. Heidi Mejia]|uniref:DUF1561 family protein n=1 Tax=Bartonella bacilliformis TaxID=774 RepID=UPI0004488FCD|nr:DUF1561 family protein [Bartonella bacilliformis]EYS92479.1 hypothetical protein X471_00164 [Bartonella bacilliformis str. Heidi Mejia]KEG19038.1 hypothetical protein H707_00782 [Bartonella bacilliformis Hosp800-02]KEG22239.1 hypothetical protein H708_00790 [Bartonella bacilliformis VAB9028]KEG24495.1 hypothetical protein H706_00792 [Bartonella bacilliformis CAR600-02]
MKLKLFFFFLSLLLTIQTSSAAPVPGVIQKPPDHPNDKAIKIRVHTGGEYCYAPTFTEGMGYIYIDNCSSSTVKARYDLFQRVAWNINDTWLCMTAPDSVTGIDKNSTADWGYLLLKPCVINDQNQRWIIKNEGFYTADEKFRVKDTHWYAYISKNKQASYDHKLTLEMKDWSSTVSPPGNISFKTYVAWLYVSVYPPLFALYYLQNDSSSISTTPLPLYYNPENGHIAQYYDSYGSFYCMASKQTTSQDWNWVQWTECTDKIPSKKDSTFWDVSQLNGNEGFILDYQGNPLRVTQYGTRWGVPYTAKTSYIPKDTTNSPTSKFILSTDIEQWNRYTNGNLGETLPFCPAPGKKGSILQTSQARKGLFLPPWFTLSEAWIQRLWQIARSTVDGTERIGFCGICMLQTSQMLAELQENYQTPTYQDGAGYFFNTAFGRDPFVSLRSRFPHIAERLQMTEVYSETPFTPTEDRHERANRACNVMISTFLPDVMWRSSAVGRASAEIARTLIGLFRIPPGTIGFVEVVRENTERTGYVAHAQPFIRTQEGIILIPTNAPQLSLDEFRQSLTPIPTTQQGLERLVLYLSVRGSQPIRSVSTFEMVQLTLPSLNVYMSQRDCTGEGDHRRGSRQLPSTSSINECASGGGRCSPR